MHLLGELLALFAVASLGIFFGAMLTEGLVLVPYWRSTPCRGLLLVVRSQRQAPSRFLRPTHLACSAICAGRGGYLLMDDPPWALVCGGRRRVCARGRLDVLRLF